jgi:hypothetical protein
MSQNGKQQTFRPHARVRMQVQNETYVGLAYELSRVRDLEESTTQQIGRWVSKLQNTGSLNAFDIRAVEVMYGRLCR